MKKLLLTGIMVLVMGACTTTQTEDVTRLSRDNGNSWVEQIGDIDSEYWWISDYSDDSE